MALAPDEMMLWMICIVLSCFFCVGLFGGGLVADDDGGDECCG